MRKCSVTNQILTSPNSDSRGYGLAFLAFQAACYGECARNVGFSSSINISEGLIIWECSHTMD